MKGLKIPKRLSEIVSQRTTNTMTKRKKKKTMIYNTKHRKIKDWATKKPLEKPVVNSGAPGGFTFK
jgi:hypothetical protein